VRLPATAALAGPAAAVLACLASALGCASKPLEERAWFEVRTKHFEITSSLPREDTLALARDAELFQTAVEFAIGAELRPSVVPVKIVALDDRTLEREFAVRGEAGSFLASLRESVIVLRTGDGWRADATARVRHEYVHHLLRSHAAEPPPLWFDEGAAEFLSTVEIGDDVVLVGRFPPDRVRLLRSETWAPLARVLAAEEIESWGARRRPVFLAASWAFLHYLNFGLEGERGRVGLATYLARRAEGAEIGAAIQEGFGESLDDLDARLQDYVRAARFREVALRSPDSAPPTLVPLAASEACARLGWLQLALGHPDRAEEWFRKAIARDDRNARAHAGLGLAQGYQGRWAPGIDAINVAIALDPKDVRSQLDACALTLRQALETRALDARSQLAESARHHCAIASQLDPSQPEAFARYGATYLLPGQDPKSGEAALEHAHRLLPASLEIELLLARLRARLGETERARAIVADVLARTHSPALREEAERVLAVIEGTLEGRKILIGPK
jgi:tetratricopeptide (TPR) repeat protein